MNNELRQINRPDVSNNRIVPSAASAGNSQLFKSHSTPQYSTLPSSSL